MEVPIARTGPGHEHRGFELTRVADTEAPSVMLDGCGMELDDVGDRQEFGRWPGRYSARRFNARP